MGEGALAEIVLLTPRGAYEKADRIANARGETVDPSYSVQRERSVGKPRWEDRAASAPMRYLLGRAASEHLVFRRVEGGFEVFRTYGGVETHIDVLKIGRVTRSKPARRSGGVSWKRQEGRRRTSRVSRRYGKH